MADNKKKKVSFAEQLKEQAGKVAPSKSDPRKESVMIELDGELVPFVRGDMSDEMWSRVKAKAVAVSAPETKKEMRLPVEVSSDAPSKLKEEDPADSKRIPAGSIDAIAKNLDFIANSVISAEEKATLMKTAPENRVGFIRERLKKRGYEIDEPTAVPTVKFDKPPEQGSPAEWKSPEPEMKKTQGTQTEDDTFVGSRPGSIRGQATRFLSAAALPSNPMAPQPGSLLYKKTKLDKAREDAGMAVDAMNADAMANQKLADAPLDQQINNAAAAARAAEAAGVMDAQARANQNAATVGESAMNVPVVDNRVNPPMPEPSLIETIDQNAGQFGQALKDVVTNPLDSGKLIGRALGGTARAAGEQLGILDRPEAPVVSDEVVQPPSPVAPPAPVDPTGKVSISAKIPGQGVAPASNVEDPVAAMRREAELQAEAQRLMAGNAQESLKAEADLMRNQQVERARLETDRQKEMLAQQAEMTKHENGLRDLQAQVLDLSKETINPNQFYDSMDTGQRISGIIAGTLFGFTGQGMQWLQRLDSLAERSVQAQAADLNRRRGLLSDAAQLQNNLVAMAEKKGLQGKAAYEAALIALKENTATQIEMNAMNFAQPELKLKAQLMASQIRQNLAKNIADYQMSAQHAAVEARFKQAQINHMEAEDFKLRAEAGGAGGMKFSPGELGRMDVAREGFETIGQIKKTLGPEQGALGAAWDEVTKRGGQFTEAGKRQKAVEPLRRVVIRLLDNSAIQKADAEYWKDKISNVGLDNMSQADLDALQALFASMYNSVIETRKSGAAPIEAPVRFTPNEPSK